MRAFTVIQPPSFISLLLYHAPIYQYITTNVINDVTHWNTGHKFTNATTRSEKEIKRIRDNGLFSARLSSILV